VIKSELILRLASQNPHLFQRDVAKLVDAVFDEIVGALARGDRVELRGFGSFSVTRRRGRVGRNPRTGATVQVREKGFPAFRPAQEMWKRLNPHGAEAEKPLPTD
jgi:integration host factor subunit beta